MLRRTLVVAVLVGIQLCIQLAPAAARAAGPDAVPLVLAQAGDRDGDLEPRYEPREPEPEPAYDSSLLFAMTRSVADSTIVPAGKPPLYLLTIPLDLAFLPIALIGGFF